MQPIVSFDNLLGSVSEPSIPEQKSETTSRQVSPVRGNDPFSYARETHTVIGTPPVDAAYLYARADVAINFGECEALIFSIT